MHALPPGRKASEHHGGTEAFKKLVTARLREARVQAAGNFQTLKRLMLTEKSFPGWVRSQIVQPMLAKIRSTFVQSPAAAVGGQPVVVSPAGDPRRRVPVEKELQGLLQELERVEGRPDVPLDAVPSGVPVISREMTSRERRQSHPPVSQHRSTSQRSPRRRGVLSESSGSLGSPRARERPRSLSRAPDDKAAFAKAINDLPDLDPILKPIIIGENSFARLPKDPAEAKTFVGRIRKRYENML